MKPDFFLNIITKKWYLHFDNAAKNAVMIKTHKFLIYRLFQKLLREILLYKDYRRSCETILS